MVQRIAVIGYTVFGVAATLCVFIIIPNLRFLNPSGYTAGFVGICIAVTNLFGLVYLIGKRGGHRRWLIATGLMGNGLSLFVIVFSFAGCLFLEYLFRM